jgi:hypothetical protein
MGALTPEEAAQRREDRQRNRLEDAAPRLRELMTKLVKQGMAGEVRVIAGRMGLAGDLPPSIIDAEPAVVFQLQAIGAMVRGGSSNIHADTCIHVHIHAYTYSVRIYFPSTYICVFYVNILHIRSYTCKVKNGDLVRVAKKMHVYCMYFDVYGRIRFSILYVY